MRREEQSSIAQTCQGQNKTRHTSGEEQSSIFCTSRFFIYTTYLLFMSVKAHTKARRAGSTGRGHRSRACTVLEKGFLVVSRDIHEMLYLKLITSFRHFFLLRGWPKNVISPRREFRSYGSVLHPFHRRRGRPIHPRGRRPLFLDSLLRN